MPRSFPAGTPVSRSSATLWLAATTVFWGGSFVFNKIGFRDFPPVLFLFLRFSLATLVMGAVCASRLRHGLGRDVLRRGFVVGLALAAANFSFVLGVSETSASRAGFLNSLYVLVVPVLAWLMGRERVRREDLPGLAVALAGLCMLAGGSGEGFNRGDLVSTLCAVFIALHLLAVSRFVHDGDVLPVTFVQFATVAVTGGILCLVLRPSVDGIGAPSLGALAYCVVFPTVLCFTIQNTFQRYLSSTETGLIFTLDPAWSMLGGMLVLGERLSPREWAGCLLILAAVTVPKLVRYLRERNAPVALQLP